jgi:hypothetical protein
MVDRCVLDLHENNLRMPGDRARLSQVFVNLPRNASVFSDPEERITVPGFRAKGVLRIEVSDRGPGIPGRLLTDLFQPFQSGRPGGSGLGLAIVQKIVSVDGSTIRARNNQPPPGATFVLDLPPTPPVVASWAPVLYQVWPVAGGRSPSRNGQPEVPKPRLRMGLHLAPVVWGLQRPSGRRGGLRMNRNPLN